MNPTITSVRIVSYCSREISPELLASYLIGLSCTRSGTLTLSLIPGRRIKQKGSIIKPPIRWITSFEENAEFEVVCTVSQENVPYMPGESVSTELSTDNKSIVFLRNNSKNVEYVP